MSNQKRTTLALAAALAGSVVVGGAPPPPPAELVQNKQIQHPQRAQKAGNPQ
ncbi:hypothetical protein Sgri01_03014 [Streptomyces griseus]